MSLELLVHLVLRVFPRVFPAKVFSFRAFLKFCISGRNHRVTRLGVGIVDNIILMLADEYAINGRNVYKNAMVDPETAKQRKQQQHALLSRLSTGSGLDAHSTVLGPFDSLEKAWCGESRLERTI